MREEGGTASLLLQITNSRFVKGKLVILGKVFCVLKAIVSLKKRGIYASALIKKRRYWSKYIDGSGIQSFMK